MVSVHKLLNSEDEQETVSDLCHLGFFKTCKCRSIWVYIGVSTELYNKLQESG